MNLYRERNRHSSIKSVFKKNIMLSWLVSYLLVFLIPFINNIYIYTKSEKELKQQIYENSSQTLNNMCMSTDKMISDFSTVIAGIQNCQPLNTLIPLTLDSPEFDITRIDLAQALYTLQQYNSYVSGIYVYTPKSEYCVSQNFTADRDKFFSHLYENTDADIDIWKENLNRLSYGSYMVTHSEDKGNIIDFFYSIPMFDNNIRATAVIRISGENLMLLSKVPASNDNITTLIADNKNQIIFSTGDYSPVEYEDIPDGTSFDKSDGNMLISLTSSLNSWKYIQVTPKKYISNQLSYLRIPIIASFLFSFLIVVILIIYFIKQNYMPVKQIITFAHKNSENSAVQSEYDLINNLLHEYSSNKQRLNSIQRRETYNRKTKLLSELSTGSFNTESGIEEEMNALDIHFISNHFAVVCFNITDADHLFSEDDSSEQLNDHETAKAIRFIMTNVFEELINKHNRGYMTETDGHLICIISCNPDRLSLCYSDIAEAVGETKRFIEENFMFSFNSSVSSIHKGIDSIPSAYWEANKTMSYRSLIKNEDTLIFDNIQRSFPDSGFNEKIDRNLTNFIRLGDYDVARSIIDNIFADSTLSINQAHILSVRIALAVSAVVLEETEYDGETDYSDYLRCLDEIISIRGNYTPYQQKLHKLVSVSCNIMGKRLAAAETENAKNDAEQEKTTDSFIDDVKEYIRLNYSNSNLHLVSLGEYFDITPYYLSNIFKKSEGVTLMDYIAQLRIQEAKKYIDSSDIPMSEIASKVGFNNVRTFLRTFRKFEGITPSQYKNLKNE